MKLNLIEAVKSGKKFTRPHWGFFYDHRRENHTFSIEDILADDWEVEEKTVTITRTQLQEAFFKNTSISSNGWFSHMARELGFDDE